MFIGHFALGYAAKRWVPTLSLGALFAAAVFADLLWPILVAAGVEQVRIAPGYTASTPLEFISYPYSHSLIALILWGGVVGWAMGRGAGTRGVVVVLLLAVSHWVLDVVTHVPDMPLYPDGPKFGLGLWNSVPGTLAVETALFATGVWMHARATKARDRTGTWAFAGITAFLFVGFIANAAGAPPPPSVRALWVMALLLSGVTLSLGWWADRHRIPRDWGSGIRD